MDKIKLGGRYCSLCSSLRRDIHITVQRFSYNKIVLDHHRDDVLEMFLLNLFHADTTLTMLATYTTDDGRSEVIRSLIECAENNIKAHSKR